MLEKDKDIPTGINSLLLWTVTLGKTVWDKNKKRGLYRKVIVAILEQIFDPNLEYKMTKKDIVDAFQAQGMDRDKVFDGQIGYSYVKVRGCPS